MWETVDARSYRRRKPRTPSLPRAMARPRTWRDHLRARLGFRKPLFARVARHATAWILICQVTIMLTVAVTVIASGPSSEEMQLQQLNDLIEDIERALADGDQRELERRMQSDREKVEVEREIEQARKGQKDWRRLNELDGLRPWKDLLPPRPSKQKRRIQIDPHCITNPNNCSDIAND